jgi:hypothetical protein
MNKTEEFIKKVRMIHGNKYDYSKVNYINNRTKVEIICPEHGSFMQIPYHHSKGCGCPICSKNKRLSFDEFLIKAIKKHDDKYDYTLCSYINMHKKIKIICPKHGIFEQCPSNHLKYGCLLCKKSKKMDTKSFIDKSLDIHGDKYDYSEVEYINSKIKVKIYCKSCGEYFLQIPGNHINKKHGCPICGNKNRRLKRIYEISKSKFNGEQIIPSFNKNTDIIFGLIMEETGYNIQHAMNGGEYYIKELGYWVDGYDKENNTVYEIDESHHYSGGILKNKDKIRQKEIEKYLKCKFIRIRI